MTDEAAAVRVAAPAHPALVPLRTRVRSAVRRPESWLQLLRFGIVGVSGYAVNLVVFTIVLNGAGLSYLIAATVAFLVAVSNNFLWNRRWTFKLDEHHRPVHHQAARFLTVSVAAFLAGLGLLAALVEGAGLPEVAAQALAIVAVTPLSFLANKLWSFGR